MDYKNIGCSAGRTIVIDPNRFDGMDSSNNVSVPLEDLSIYVQLETTRKARTLLQGTSSFNSGEFKVTFIEGEDVSGRKVLTTRYTDLTTSFDKGQNNPSLGISSIDIDFNTSQAPMIVINFIDIRGSAVFQNESMLNNKYSTLFEMPYPIFNLTIKGYYGLPVTYELHMTKFNSKFNSKTGNFEITANFVGYTYAMLSDMLIGLLRAIAHTEKGKKKYDDLKETNNYILTLDELITATSKIDVTLNKLPSTEPVVVNLAIYTEKLNTQLPNFIDALNNLAVVMGETAPITEKIDFVDITDTNKWKVATDSYGPATIANTTKYNEGMVDIKFIDDELSIQYAPECRNLTIDSLKNLDANVLITHFVGVKASDVENVRTALIAFVEKKGINGTFTVRYLKPFYDKIEAKKIELEKKIKELSLVVGETIKNIIAANLTAGEGVGLQPTIRNIVEIFTISVEVLMSVLFEVSTEALKNTARTTQLEKYIPSNNNPDNNSYDYGISDTSKTTDTTYYPWPEYRKKDAITNGLVETYLGDAGVLQIPLDVDELKFIDDLLKAFYESLKVAKDAEDVITKIQNAWGSVNPMDTILFGLTEYPFDRIDKEHYLSVVGFLVNRASIFMSLSNKSITDDDIEKFANFEVANLRLSVDSTNLKAISTLTIDPINIKGKINGVEVPVLKQINLSGTDYYFYDYIFADSGNIKLVSDTSTIKLLPLNNVDKSFDFNHNFGLNVSEAETKSFNENGNIFLTNYTSTQLNDGSGTIYFKPDDGGVYIKIFSRNEFDESVKPLPESVIASTNTILLTDLDTPQPDFDKKVVAGEVLNQFGSYYGVPEFFTLNIPNIGEKAPFRAMFFVDDTGYKGGPTICKERKSPLLTDYDINNSKGYIKYFEKNYFSPDDYVDFTYGANAMHSELGQNRLNLISSINTESGVSYPYISYGIGYGVGGVLSTDISLFGSRFYYAQTSDLAKAFLFLHTFPWDGLIGEQNLISCIFSLNEIVNTFGNKAGFVSAPKLWAAFVGGLLWRGDSRLPILDDNNVQIGGGSGPLDPIIYGVLNAAGDKYVENYIPNLTDPDLTPAKDCYLHDTYKLTSQKYAMSFLSDDSPSVHEYLPIDMMLKQLPEQVKNEFKKAFFDFVGSSGSGSEWQTVKYKLELINSGGDGAWKNYYNGIVTTTVGNIDTMNPVLLKRWYTGADSTGKKALDNYVMLNRYKLDDYPDTKYHYVSELKDKSDAMNYILGLINEEVVIANTNIRIWDLEQTKTFNESDRGRVYIPKKNMDDYLTKVKEKLQVDNKTQAEIEAQQSQELFGTTNKNLIKFQLYRTCKNIYDKWIGGAPNEDEIIFRGGLPARNGLDVELAKNRAKVKGGSSTPSLIDSFRFVTRSFRDIGDELYINPTNISNTLTSNPSSSFYDVVTSLLSQNNFNFTPLPNFINFGDPEDLEKMFQPLSTLDSFKSGSTGPAFVCVYVGQPSKTLDFNNSYYKHDGIDFQCGKDRNLIIDVAQDFSTEKQSYENNVAVFSVNYSQQNQNLFKDITLDQSEFTETSESLQLVDEISRKGAENRTTMGGQNLYDVYSVRSYKAEVEMMGNAMIQPMMYFQLNNIPMFHGGYLIIHVKHSITPNHMLTNFTGVRVRNVETPILDAASLYMPLIDSVLGNQPTAGKSVNSSTVYTNSGAGFAAAGCGTFAFSKPIVDGVNGFYLTKPIRDLVALVESRGNYDAYNNGTAGVQGPTDYRPSTLTIARIKELQAKTGNDRIFAVGKYQLIPVTFNNMVNNLGLQSNDIYNAEVQEKAGEYLILTGAGWRAGLKAYFATGSDGNEKDLQKAITDLALEFASFPTYFGVNRDQALKYANPIGYQQKTAMYGGKGGNLPIARFCAQDVAKALIQTWKNLNPNKKIAFDYSNITSVVNQGAPTPQTVQTVNSTFTCSRPFQKVTTNMNSKSIILGDSTVGVFTAIGNTLKNNGIDISYNCEGENLPWLVNELDKLAKTNAVYSTIKHVFVSIGTNDGYKVNTSSKNNVIKLNNLITKLCPNAKKIVVPGTYGWGKYIANLTKVDQDAYYKMYQDLGWVYRYPSASAYCSDVGKAHDSNSDWFKKSVELIVALNKT